MKTVAITTDDRHPTISYAMAELRSFIERTTNLVFIDDDNNADYSFTLRKDGSLNDTCYSVSVTEADDCTMVTLAGHDNAGILHAVYEMLEQGGIYFDVMGPVLPDQLDLSALRTETQVITPFVRKRGIRQHINFTMDISSYPLEEAKEYIRNLARMRMNHMTFHSYNGQWFGYTKDDKYQHGGSFFYGSRFSLPDDELFTRNIRNRSVYCIPEIEPVIDNPEERSRMASEWLNSVIAECHHCGMHVQLSIEPPGRTQAEGMTACRDVLELYPTIDTFELITPECGNSERTLSVDELKTYLIDLFGDDVLDKEMLESLKPDLQQLEGGLRHVARNIRLLEELQSSSTQPFPALAIGSYITCPDSLCILHQVMHRYTSENTSLTFLPAHGARRVVTNLKQMNFTRESITRSMLYGWIEFDGNMFLQQNSIVGAKQLLEFAKDLTGASQVQGAALNHWRTAENRACIAYAAKAFIRGPIAPDEFYAEYAAVFGLESTERFATTMQELDDLDDLSREKMFNIGFCVNGCWVRPGLRWTARWNNDSITACRERYQQVVNELEMCLASAMKPAGQELIRFLINRVECTLFQLDAAQAIKSLAAFCDHDHPEALSAEQKLTVTQVCDKAMSSAQRYLEKHAEMIIDRGCEGMLINYQTTMPNYIDHIRAVFVEGEEECSHFLPQLDETPAPVTN